MNMRRFVSRCVPFFFDVCTTTSCAQSDTTWCVNEICERERAKWLNRILDDESDEFKSSIHSFVFNFCDDFERGICMMATHIFHYYIEWCQSQHDASPWWWVVFVLCFEATVEPLLNLNLTTLVSQSRSSLSLSTTHHHHHTHRIDISPLPTLPE